MSSKEILEKAIQKAIDGGWSILQRYEAPAWWIEASIRDWVGDNYSMAIGIEGTGPVIVLIPARSFLLDHDFAKALWGDSWKEDCKTCGFTHYMYDKDQYDDEQADPYIYHLQQMVIAQDPIKYLGEHLDA